MKKEINCTIFMQYMEIFKKIRRFFDQLMLTSDFMLSIWEGNQRFFGTYNLLSILERLINLVQAM